MPKETRIEEPDDLRSADHATIDEATHDKWMNSCLFNELRDEGVPPDRVDECPARAPDASTNKDGWDFRHLSPACLLRNTFLQADRTSCLTGQYRWKPPPLQERWRVAIAMALSENTVFFFDRAEPSGLSGVKSLCVCVVMCEVITCRTAGDHLVF